MTDNPRYPIGGFHLPGSHTPATRSAAIAALDALPADLRKAVHGLSDAQLDTPYRDGGWTLRQVVHHLADSHVNAYIRLRFTLTEDRPTVKPYDEGDWANLPDARTGPVAPSLSLLDGLHTRWAILARTFTPADFARIWIHPVNGERTVDWTIEFYAWHSRHHVAHITALRAARHW
ncbi:MAG: putative metal-dependent hydrolase [Gemmatimonadaceae bacterium]|nr:putative metal-dependent hydrolase [Gemmatimonadaceae bacterium]